jgi:hypothetical protein
LKISEGLNCFTKRILEISHLVTAAAAVAMNICQLEDPDKWLVLPPGLLEKKGFSSSNFSKTFAFYKYHSFLERKFSWKIYDWISILMLTMWEYQLVSLSCWISVLVHARHLDNGRPHSCPAQNITMI